MKLRDMLTALIILELIMLAFWLGTRDAEAQGQLQLDLAFVPLMSFQVGGIRPQGDMEPRDWPFDLDWTVIDPTGGVREPVRQSPDGQRRNDDEEDDAGDCGRGVGDGAGGAGGG